MHGQREDWTGCLLARAINLQLEVSDRWDGKKKAGFFGTLEQNCLGCVRVPPARQVQGGTRGAAACLVPLEEEGSSSPGDEPRVLLGGSGEPRCARQSSPGKFQSQTEHPLCCAYGSLGLKLCRSWVSGSLLFLPVKQGWNMGSEFPQ